MLDNYHLNQLAEPLLAWFVDHARVLPWRERPEPYRVGLGNHAAADQSGGSKAVL